MPFSSDVLYIAVLATTGKGLGCFLAATSGSWLGSLFTYYLGWLGKWEWIEKWFKVSHEKLERHHASVRKYGAWLALLSGVPVVGDILVLALGFYRTVPGWTAVLLLVGKLVRFLIWNGVVGLF